MIVAKITTVTTAMPTKSSVVTPPLLLVVVAVAVVTVAGCVGVVATGELIPLSGFVEVPTATAGAAVARANSSAPMSAARRRVVCLMVRQYRPTGGPPANVRPEMAAPGPGWRRPRSRQASLGLP